MLDPDTCYAAVLARDPGADGTFFVGVKTTGVYCRPHCPSRTPLRRNVTFHASAAEGEAAGFRPCKRCRPNEPSAAARQLAAVERACALIAQSETMPPLAELADAAGISRFHFHRLFKQVTGTTPGVYSRTRRLARLAGQLDAGEPVSAAIYGAGFGSGSRAYAAAPAALGMTPGKRRGGGAGVAIRFAVVPTAIGLVLLAASARGVCHLAFGEERGELETTLRARFPAAEIREADAELGDWAARVLRFIAAPERQPELPLDIIGTAFQAQVWRALQRIPPGRTASYAEIAAAIGRPTAVRAVARACASNSLALLVPCHRVVRGDGGLGGYRWGVARKRDLLDREADAARAGGERAA